MVEVVVALSFAEMNRSGELDRMGETLGEMLRSRAHPNKEVDVMVLVLQHLEKWAMEGAAGPQAVAPKRSSGRLTRRGRQLLIDLGLADINDRGELDELAEKLAKLLLTRVDAKVVDEVLSLALAHLQRRTREHVERIWPTDRGGARG